MKKIILLLLISTFISACNNKPQPIAYGSDGCDFCRMTIVDRGHAAQLVTKKGKNYKFDAIECLIHYLEDKEEADFAFILTASLTQPGTLLTSTEATFLISPNISSPMGAFLSAVADEKEALEIVEKNKGDVYNWEAVKKVINQK